MFVRYENKAKHEECFFCSSPAVRDFRLWKLIENEFPYDAVAEKHYLLAPKRHFASVDDMNQYERHELQEIRDQLESEKEFDCILENLARGRTVPDHYHLHLIQWQRA